MILCLLVCHCISALVTERGTEDVQCFWSSFLQWLEAGVNDFSEFYTAVMVQDFKCRCAQSHAYN